MFRRYRADLHVHTCLSPCGDLLMSPQKIAARVSTLNIALIAICDHNSAGNIASVTQAAAGSTLVVLPGMEVCTKEEVHVLAIFEHITAVYAMQSLIYDHLPGKNDPEVFGDQVIANERDEIVAYEDRLLIGAADMSVEHVVNNIHRLGGIAIASHIDRESYSVISQLGFIPDTVPFDALELSAFISTGVAQERFGTRAGCPFVRNSDAHVLADLGKNTTEYVLACPTFGELRMALRGQDGRCVYEAP